MLGYTRLSREDKALLIDIIHSAQDMWADAQNDLAGCDNPEDKTFLAAIEDQLQRADKLRKRLGDEWTPAEEVTDQAIRQLIEEEK